MRSRANKSSQQDANNAAPAVTVNLQTAHLDPERERQTDLFGMTETEQNII